MEIAYDQKALGDILFWKKSGNKKVQQKIALLIKDISINPYAGLGKPEQLRHTYSGTWSRRIDKGNRIIYSVEEQLIKIYSLKGHYQL